MAVFLQTHPKQGGLKTQIPHLGSPPKSRTSHEAPGVGAPAPHSHPTAAAAPHLRPWRGPLVFFSRLGALFSLVFKLMPKGRHGVLRAKVSKVQNILTCSSSHFLSGGQKQQANVLLTTKQK